MEEIIILKEKSSINIVDRLFNDIAEFRILEKDTDYYTVKHLKTDQITYVKKGQGLAVLDGIEYEIAEGNILLIPKDTSHSFKVYSSQMELLHYHTSRTFIDEDIVIIKEGKNG